MRSESKARKIQHRSFCTASFVAAVCAMSLMAPIDRALAQDQEATKTSGNALTLEEVLVTARKREESLQEVPISITVVQGEAMRNLGQTNLELVSPSIPNFTYAEAIISSDIFMMRGLGTAGINVGFEQAVR